MPYAGFCERPDDVCSCSFTASLPAVAEYCGSDAASVDRATAEAVANITAALRQCAAAVDATPFGGSAATHTCTHVDVEVCSNNF